MSFLKAALLFFLTCLPTSAITISIDYRYDTNGFFGAGNPYGAAAGRDAKKAIEAAARFFSERITDDLDAIIPAGSNTWDAYFLNPQTGNIQSLTNPTISSDTLIVFVGARKNILQALAETGPGGHNAAGTQSWINAFTQRGEGAATTGSGATEFAPWGGSIGFNSLSEWHFDYTSTAGLDDNKNDFYSVALHELAHILGIGGSSKSWYNMIQDGLFTGKEATAANGGISPSIYFSQGHFAKNIKSTVFEGFDIQEVAMDPDLSKGTRKLMTRLDMAALSDIGWDIVSKDNDGVVDTEDESPLDKDKSTTVASLGNLSTRGYIGTGDNVLIAGIVIKGTGTKRVLITGRGASVNVPGNIANTQLRVVDQSTKNELATSDDYASESQAANIKATNKAKTIVATDAAVILELKAGAYTALVSGKNGATGIGIVEIFDLAPDSSAKIINLSTRGRVGTGDNIMIGGLIVAGNSGQSAKVVVRGKSPSSGAYKPGTWLADPRIEIYDGQNKVLENDDWTSDPGSGDIPVKLRPGSPNEPTLRLTLPANTARTVQLKGSNRAEGIGIIEFFVE